MNSLLQIPFLSFADYISKHQNSDNLVIASFDIISLFINIPLEETLDIIV